MTHSAKFFKKRLSKFLKYCRMGGNKLMNKNAFYMEGTGVQDKKLDKIKIRLEELQTEIIGESDETVHGMQEESTLYPDPNDRASLET